VKPIPTHCTGVNQFGGGEAGICIITVHRGTRKDWLADRTGAAFASVARNVVKRFPSCLAGLRCIATPRQECEVRDSATLYSPMLLGERKPLGMSESKLFNFCVCCSTLSRQYRLPRNQAVYRKRIMPRPFAAIRRQAHCEDTTANPCQTRELDALNALAIPRDTPPRKQC
jgi:hypothetical protein